MRLKLQIGVMGASAIFAFLPLPAHADQATLTPYSWDSGLYATNSTYNDQVHAWGKRLSAGAWGTGAVNYQSGATTHYDGASSGIMHVRLNGTYCPSNNCSYGTGTGYKGLVQFWNDPNNFIAFGLIHDPGVSPNGMTIMVEGSANGRPVGGYWPAGAISGASHLFTVTWNGSGITLNVDNQVTLGSYPVTETKPSISFLAAGRQTGDIVDTTFTNVSFASGSITPQPVVIPAGNPYFTYTNTLTENGSGTGHSAYINAHDAQNNAVAVGIQADTGAPESNGQPYYIWELVQNGVFTYDYLGPASHNPTPITLKWWKDGTAVFYANGTPLTNIQANLTPRLFFNVEGNARLNGDTLSDTFTNAQISVGDTCPTYCGLNGSWNTSSFNFHGLTASNTNAQPQNGANFTVNGTVSGLGAGQNWDTNEVAGIGMIAQYWNGQ